MDCDTLEQQTVSMPLTYRKGDYGNPAPGSNGINEIVDDVLSADGTHAIESWTFGGPTATFMASRGDGGLVAVIGADKIVRATMTQDGGTPGRQYICGTDGWVFFDAYAPNGSWRSMVAMLQISFGDAANCPSPLNPSFTRWRLEDLGVPFLIDGAAKTLTLSCVISEHYNGATIEAAVSMEQDIWCANWGRIWWAGYSTAPKAGPEWFAPAPTIIWPGPPERPDFNSQGARLTTNVISTPGGPKQSAFGWP